MSQRFKRHPLSCLKGSQRSHDQLCNTVMQWLDLKGCPAWRNESKPVRITRRDGSAGYIQRQETGLPDVMAVLKPRGILLACEVKTGRQLPRPKQREWLDKIESAGGIAITAKCLDDVIDATKGLIG